MGAYLNILRKNRAAQALALLLAAAAAFDATFYILRTAAARDQVATLRLSVQELDRETRLKDNELALYLSFDEGRKGVDSFKGLLPRRSEYTSILKRLHRMAREDGMKSESFGTENKTMDQEGDLDHLSFSMPVSGSYPSVRKYIYDLESSPVFLNINNLGLSGADKSDDISLTIGLSTYVRS